MTFTVVAVYHDNMQLLVVHIESESSAEAVAGLRRRQKSEGSQVAILAVFEGEHLDLWNQDELMVT